MPRPRPTCLLVASALLAAACSAPLTTTTGTGASLQGLGQNEPPDFRSPGARSTEPFGLERLNVDVAYVPALWIQPDVDSDTSPSRDADLDPGSGVFARAGLGTKQQNIGISYLGSWHDENDFDAEASTQSVYLDFLYRAPVPSLNNTANFAVAAGLGLATLAFDGSQFDDEVTGALQLRGELEFPIWKPLSLSAGFGGFLWGNPGETIAYGTFVLFGAKLVF